MLYPIPILILSKVPSNNFNYFFLLGFHAFLGVLLYFVPILATPISLAIFALGLLYIFKNQNRNNEILTVCAYLVGGEVLFRMTGGNLLNEITKYQVLVVCLLGFFYSGFSRNAIAYWLYILLLIPAVVVSITSLNIDTNIRKAIAFNIVGPVTLGIAAIYCYRRTITFSQMLSIIVALALPIVSMLAYLLLYNPSVRDVVTGTSSNFETSGGFGPNQVSTILGLGMFLFATLALFQSRSKLFLIIHLALLIIVSYRGIVTFSRGGVITGVVMIVLLMVMIFRKGNNAMRTRLVIISIVTGFLAVGIWTYTSFQTSGLIDKRYANQDAMGREKADALGGRETIAKTELDMFLENPIFGIGVGKNKEYREEQTGIVAASHNEITRLLAEHGMFGIFALLILLITPLVLSIDNKQHILLFSFCAFWLLTINHAAMRTASPAFIYALSLLKITGLEKPAIHRE